METEMPLVDVVAERLTLFTLVGRCTLMSVG